MDSATPWVMTHTRQDMQEPELFCLQCGAVGVFSASRPRGQQANEDAATTLSIVELNGNTMRPYHVGDSLILVTGGRGKLKLQTVSHSPIGYRVEAGLLDEEDAIQHERRNVVSNLVGMPDMRIEVGAPLRLARRDTLLLASLVVVAPDSGRPPVCSRRPMT